jgi:hypothetical protein
VKPSGLNAAAVTFNSFAPTLEEVIFTKEVSGRGISRSYVPVIGF